jgi:hypothetical protein
LRGEAPIPAWFLKEHSPVWDRHYSDEVDADDCELLDGVLERLSAKRMIVGHTVHDGETVFYCSQKVWCIDSGMAAHYGGPIRVLEIVGDNVRVLTED